MKEKFAPNNVAALLLLVLFFSQLSVSTGGGSERKPKSEPERPAAAPSQPVPSLYERPLVEVLADGEIGRWDDYAVAQISARSFSAERAVLNARIDRIKYKKKTGELHVEMGIDTLFSNCSPYVDAHRREIAARFFVAYNSWTSGLVDKIIEEDIPVNIAVKFNYWHAGKQKTAYGDVVEEIRYAGRRELLDACGMLPPALDYHGKLDLRKWNDK